MASSATVTDGAQRWDADDIRAAVSDWAVELERRSARVVAIELPNGLEWEALNLALLETRRVAVPIPDFFNPNQRAHVLAASGADLIVSKADADDRGPGDRFRWTRVTRLDGSAASKTPERTAVVTFTSGSTGTPRGVCLSAETLRATAQGVVSALADQQIGRHLSVLPLTLLLENVAGLYANLLHGSEILLPDLTTIGLTGSSGLDVARFVRSIADYQPHSVILVPALLLAMTAASEFDLVRFEGLTFAAVGGGKVPTSLIERARAQNIPVYEGYGLTECGSVIALNTPAGSRAGSAGRLLPHVEAHVRNGELFVEKPRMLSYLDRDISLSASERPAAVATGDLAKLDPDGFLTIQGRRKNVFITAFGRNVSPEWPESELQAEIGVAHALVFGEGAAHAAALIVPRGDADDAAIDEAVRSCNLRLPDYARIHRWHRVELADIKRIKGLTDNGRTRRNIVETKFRAVIDDLLSDSPGCGRAPRLSRNTNEGANGAQL